jgi:hypothetical protein
MQAEEIIQQKEWQQLTIEEKSLLQPLAADEQEFNLLKKMFAVVNETTEIPDVNPDIQTRVRHLLNTGNQKPFSFKTWYYAAAAIIVIALTTWFFFSHTANKNNNLVETTPGEKPTPAQQPIHKDSSLPKKQNGDITFSPENKVREKNIKRNAAKKSDPDNMKNRFTAISTLVASDSTLLALVTEVY